MRMAAKNRYTENGPMTRDRLIEELRIKYHCGAEIVLMNHLQDVGLVSDEAVNLQDVPDRDLIKAFQA